MHTVNENQIKQDLSAVANNSNQNQPGQKAGSDPDQSSRSNEFDDAVTSDIPDYLTKAFDEHHTGDQSDLFVTDLSLTEYVDIESDEVLPPGFLLRGRFKIVELVYAAGMSYVYKAIDQLRRVEGANDVHVAIKIIRPSIVSEYLARLSLEREAAIAQSLSHPNIINIFEFDELDGQSFLVMEWLEGESVNAMLRRTSGEGVEAGLARTVITCAATGVQHAHRNGIVHADINPSNIFITDALEIKLLDFGVARSASAPEKSEEDRFAFVTQTYASPEVLSGLPPVVEDDVFSLACVVYRLLSGRHPFGGVLSLGAKHKGLSVEPIPGLGAQEWETLRRALSYERSDRPNNVDEFVTWDGGVADAEIDESATRPAWRFSALHQTWLATIAAAVILAGGAWLYQRGTVDGTTAPVGPAVVEETSTAEPDVSASRALVIAATQALRDGQLVAPADVNARALFRTALALEPGNAEALRGLRTISSEFVQEAHEALNRDDPLAAYAALTVATETDPADPAIGIAGQLLSAKGDGALSDARLAAATGNLDLAAQKLSQAEQYQHIDQEVVEDLRRQIEEGRQSDLLLAGLAIADAHIEADRLLLPEGENANALLLGLQEQFNGDMRLVEAKERLGERLLMRAAFAVAATDVLQVRELLDAVDALGVLTSEVEAARSRLAVVVSEAETVEAPGPQVAVDPKVVEEQPAIAMDSGNVQPPQTTVEQPDNTSPQSSASALDVPVADDLKVADDQPAIAMGSGDAQPLQTTVEQSDNTPLQASASAPDVPEEAVPEAGTTPADPEPSRSSLRELGIREYTAPTFPRRALRRNISGMVEVKFVVNAAGTTESIEVVRSEPGDLFSQSAVNAINQWRFEAREEPVNAQIVLRFDQ